MSTVPAVELDLVDRVFDAIAECAIVGPSGAMWCEPVPAMAGAPALHRTGDATLYQGSAGVGLALAVAADSMIDPRVGALASLAIQDALARIDDISSIGLYDGRAGIGLSALVVGRRIGDAHIERRGLDILVDIATRPGRSGSWDFISGDAGLAAALAMASQICHDDRLRAGALACVERLASAAIECSGSRAWGQVGEDWLPLCGLAHGTAGASYACDLVADALPAGANMMHVVATAEAARRHERSWYDRIAQAWPDLRAGRAQCPGDGVFPSLWCHGAVGVGLVALDRFDRYRDPADGACAAAALQKVSTDTVAAVRAVQLGHGLTLCHGMGGAVELLLTAYNVFGEDEHLATAKWIARHTATALGSDVGRWPTGIDGGLSSAGLMTGLSGTLLTLLRLTNPRTVPSPALLGRLVGATRCATSGA